MAQILLELQQQIEKTLELMEAVSNTNTTAESVPNEMRTTLTSAKRIIELHQSPQSEKTLQNIEKLQSPREACRETKEIARHLHNLRESYVRLERSLFLLKLKHDKDHEEIPRLDAYVEIMDEEIKNIEALQGDVAELKAEREKLRFWQGRRKREIDKELELVEANCHVAQHAFNSKYHIALNEAHFEIRRIRKEILFKTSDLDKKKTQIAETEKELDVIESQYCAQRQIADNHPDRALIDNLLEQMREVPVSARDNLRRVQLERKLDKTVGGKIR